MEVVRPIKQRVSPRKWPYAGIHRNAFECEELELRRFLNEADQSTREMMLRSVVLVHRFVRTLPVWSDAWKTA